MAAIAENKAGVHQDFDTAAVRELALRAGAHREHDRTSGHAEHLPGRIDPPGGSVSPVARRGPGDRDLDRASQPPV